MLKNVIGALPLVADALGRKYGVKVYIGGQRAYTDGSSIHIPALPMDSDEPVLNLARGYLDHEAAHLRATDFAVLKKAKLSALEKHIWNIIEDFVVERKLGGIYPGCRDNFNWLSKHLFASTEENQQYAMDENPGQNVFNWILYALRSLDVPELGFRKILLGKKLDEHVPGLTQKIRPILDEIATSCTDTTSAIVFARQIAKTIEAQVSDNPPGTNASDKPSEDKPKEATGNTSAQDNESSEDIKSRRMAKSLKRVLDDPSGLKSLGIGDMVENLLENESVKDGSKLTIAISLPPKVQTLSEEALLEISRETRGLRSRLRGLLQASVLVSGKIGRVGKVALSRLARLELNDPKIFLKRSQKQSYDTIVHILLDASGSMRGPNMHLACQACYAVALALKNTSGIEVMVSAFPGGAKTPGEELSAELPTVSPILGYGERLHDRFLVYANGWTPMAETLWWVLQQMQHHREDRKIVLVLSDGEPNNRDDAVNAIRILRENGIEVYGVGMATEVMSELMGNQFSRSIHDLKELAPTLLALLKKSLFARERRPR